MLYKPELRNFTDVSEFNYDSPCVWVVYPAGCGGDLWGSIVGHHYPRTGNHFLGIDTTGRVMLDTIDHKYLNIKINNGEPALLNQDFLNQINAGYQTQNFPHSMSGQCIIVNHFWKDSYVRQILSRFSAAKVVRILPSTDLACSIAKWLGQWKNSNTLIDFDSVNIKNAYYCEMLNSSYAHERLIDLKFEELWSESGFEKSYDQIVQHLNLPYKLVRYDLIKFWFNCQHETIKPHLNKLFEQH